LNTQVIIDQLVSRITLMPGAGGISEDTVRRLAEAMLPAVQEMLAHQGRQAQEAGTCNSYLDRLEGRLP
jgi:hypothetical protein